MNPLVAENEFRVGLEKLLVDIDHTKKSSTTNPHTYAKDKVIHEHETRVFFFDRLLELLGWNLGMEGNVTQEARIKAGTTKFVDYVGINQDMCAPVLIFEAKAWDNPIITGNGKRRGWPKVNLIIEAVKHVNAGGDKESSPVMAKWHEHLSQLAGYVRDYKEQLGHEVSRAVLSSGQWLLVFTEPVSTFCGSKVNDQQFHLFEREHYIENAHVIFSQLARINIADSVPFPIRPPQLGNYVRKEHFSAAYHGMLIHYEASGTPIFAQRPRILVYPSVIIQRNDGALITVIDAEEPITMQNSHSENDEETLGPHLDAVATAAEKLLQSCSVELSMPLKPRELDDFPGFPTESVMDVGGLALDRPQKLFLKPVRSAINNWIAVTGRQTHYLHEQPKVVCQFNAWAACNAVKQSIGANGVNSPATENPRAYFVDGQPHHCAHQTVINRRDARCYIKAIDARTCCNACVYHESCWSPVEASDLPCGT